MPRELQEQYDSLSLQEQDQLKGLGLCPVDSDIFVKQVGAWMLDEICSIQMYSDVLRYATHVMYGLTMSYSPGAIRVGRSK